LLFGLLALGACRPFEPATPPGFVELEDRYENDEYRATTADGVVLGVRAYDNEPKGDLGFWTRALENRMREGGGYALLETRKVKARSGLEGKQLRFGHDEEKAPHLYIVTLFVDDDHVFVLEAGGEKSEMERLMPQIDWAVSGFLPK
jgi:hypothetical protein